MESDRDAFGGTPSGKLSVECSGMSNPAELQLASRRKEIEAKLRAVDQQLRSEMLARGFDPAQDENLALTAPLAKLYLERENLRQELETLNSAETQWRMVAGMTEVERIIDQLNRTLTGGAWHGSAVVEILDGITSEQAASRPINGAHSIWELVLHIETWLRACNRRLAGERAQLADAEDWRAVTDTSERAWADAWDALTQARVDLGSAISRLDDSQLDQPMYTFDVTVNGDVIEGMSSVYVTLHGVIQHTLYHAGQIAILKKALSERQPHE